MILLASSLLLLSLIFSFICLIKYIANKKRNKDQSSLKKKLFISLAILVISTIATISLAEPTQQDSTSVSNSINNESKSAESKTQKAPVLTNEELQSKITAIAKGGIFTEFESVVVENDKNRNDYKTVVINYGNSQLDQALDDIIRDFKEIYSNEWPISQVTINVSKKVEDAAGNTKIVPDFYIMMTKESAQKINWTTFKRHNILKVADKNNVKKGSSFWKITGEKKNDHSIAENKSI